MKRSQEEIQADEWMTDDVCRSLAGNDRNQQSCAEREEWLPPLFDDTKIFGQADSTATRIEFRRCSRKNLPLPINSSLKEDQSSFVTQATAIISKSPRFN